MTVDCQHTNTCMELLTVHDLAQRYPSLLKSSSGSDGAAGRGMIDLLAECGYRFADREDIIRAQNGEFADLRACLHCRVAKIIYCP